MTTATTPSTTMPRWLPLAGWQLAGYAMIFGGFLAAAVVVAAVALILVARSTTPTMSALQFAQQAAPWFGFAVAIHYVVGWLGTHVAAGMTRRAFVKAAVAAAAGFAALGALALTVLLYAERWVYALLGWTAAADSGRVLATQAPLVPHLWGLFLLLFIAALTGLVVGLSYARLGAVATFLLPLTLSPLILTSLFAFDPATMFSLVVIRIDGGLIDAHTWVPALLRPGAVVVGPVIAAATVVAVHLPARRLPIRSPRA